MLDIHQDFLRLIRRFRALSSKSHDDIQAQRTLIRMCKEVLALWEKWLDEQERSSQQ